MKIEEKVDSLFDNIDKVEEVTEELKDVKADNVDYDAQGRAHSIRMKNGAVLTLRLFREVFLNCLRFNIAGETLTPYYYREYQKKITPQTFATHLQNVEAQARVDQMKLMNLTGRQKIAIGVIVFIIIIMMFAFIILGNSGLFG